MDARLIIDAAARGSWNMAVDEALLQWAGQGGGAALRFYRWEVPTLSLGYFQQAQARHQHPPSADLPIVRRTTGGGAIVHDRELTYSFVAPIRNRFAAVVQDFVKHFHDSLIAVLAEHNVAAQLCGDAASESAPAPFLCFQRRNALDILVGREKIVGSAQRRHHGALLQHGSILLARSPHATVLPGLAELSSAPIDPDELIARWSQRLGKHFGLAFRPSELTEAESALAGGLEADRFAQRRWIDKR